MPSCEAEGLMGVCTIPRSISWTNLVESPPALVRNLPDLGRFGCSGGFRRPYCSTKSLTPSPPRRFNARVIRTVHPLGGRGGRPRDRPDPPFGSPGSPEKGVQGPQRKLFTKPLPSWTFGRLKRWRPMDCRHHSQPVNYAASLSAPSLALTHASLHITKRP